MPTGLDRLCYPARARVRRSLLALCLILWSPAALAQDASLSPPVLRDAPPPELPAGPVPEGLEVVLELRVDPQGAVQDARVTEGRGEPWDTVALVTVRRYRFDPARRDGQAIEARIQFRLRLVAPPPPPPPPVETPPEPAPAAPPVAEPVAPVPPAGEEEPPTYETVVTARARAPEPVRRTLEQREFTRIAGTGGDALRAVQNLPGVARAQGLSGDLIVRGSSPQDTEVFLDGIPIPLLYHFGGLTSVVNSDLLSRIDFLPGNFTARYARVQGGIVDVVPRSPKDDRLHAVAEVDVIDAGFLAEGPIGSRGSFAVAARRSYVDLFLDAVIPEDQGLQFTAAPVYWDYQALGELRLGGRDRLRGFVFGSSDRLALLFADPSTDDPAVRGALSALTAFHRGTVSLDQRLDRGTRHTAAVSFGRTELAFSLGQAVEFHVDTWPLVVRDELRFDLGGGSSLTAGLDLQVQYFNVLVKAPPPTLEGQPGEKLSTQAILETEGDGWIVRPAIFLETELRPTRALRLVPGVRFDYFGELERAAIDPRVSLLWEVAARTTLKAAAGAYSQPPTLDQSDDTTFGTSGLLAQRAIHYGVGVEQQLTTHIDVGVEGFYKTLSNLVQQVPAETERGYDYSNDGLGRIYGIEALVRHRPSAHFFGWIAYTLLRSERQDHPGQPWRLFDYDQTHILTLVAGLTLAGGWELGARFRLVSGNPTTPILGPAYYDADADTYVPRYGDRGSARLPTFHQLDLRVDKKWTFSHWAFSVYLDVQNVYNQQNPEATLYNFDYSESTSVSGLPILPSLGVRGEL